MVNVQHDFLSEQVESFAPASCARGDKKREIGDDIAEPI